MNCVYFEDNTELCRPSERTRKWQIHLYVFRSGKSYIFNTLYGKQLSHRNVSFSRSKLSQTLGLGHVIQVESWITFVRKAEIFPFEKVRQHWKFFIVNESRRTAYKIRSCIVLKDAFAKKLCCDRTSQLYYFYMFLYIQCRRRRRPTNRLHLKFPFSRWNWRSRSSPFPVNRRRRRELRRGS